jgi:uncharacterized protein (DUF3084 family)
MKHRISAPFAIAAFGPQQFSPRRRHTRVDRLVCARALRANNDTGPLVIVGNTVCGTVNCI